MAKNVTTDTNDPPQARSRTRRAAAYVLYCDAGHGSAARVARMMRHLH